MLASYELFHLLTRSCVFIPHLMHKFAFSFMPHTPNFKITFFRFYIIDCSVSFDSRVLNNALLCVLSIFDIQVCLFDFQHHVFSDFISQIAPLISIRMFEHKNPISNERTMNFFINSHALVCPFLIYGTSLLFLSCLTPRLSKSHFLGFISQIAPLASSLMFEHKSCDFDTRQL